METAFRDLKHGIGWRPARCTSERAVRGRILISFLALFCLSMVRFLHTRFATMTAELMVAELTSFSLTVIRGSNGPIRRVYSNFGPIIEALRDGKRSVSVPKAPGQTVIEGFSTRESAN